MTEPDDLIETMRRAIRAVRREGYKAAFITAVFDGTLVGLLVTLALTVVRLDVVPLWYVSFAVGVVAATASFARRVRQPLVERFEAVNPEVHEALRTARDAIEDDDTSPMARALYADVVARLSATSSMGLLDLPRIAARFVLLFAFSLAVVQASMVGFGVGAGPTGPSDGTAGDGPAASPSGGATPTPTGLQPADDVLGEPTAVTPGGENLSSVIRRGVGQGDDRRQREYETGGLGRDAPVEAERTGYAPPDDIENADLIREYNLRIREATDD